MGGMVCLAGGMVCLAGGMVCLAGGMVCLAGGKVCQFDHDASKEISACSTSKSQTAEVTHRHLYYLCVGVHHRLRVCLEVKKDNGVLALKQTQFVDRRDLSVRRLQSALEKGLDGGERPHAFVVLAEISVVETNRGVPDVEGMK